MNVMFRFMRTMFANGIGLAVWISLLLGANMLVPFIVITTAEGQLVLVSALAGAATQLAIFRVKGFVRLLGVGHVYWLPLLPWLATRLEGSPGWDLFSLWIVFVIVLKRRVAGHRRQRRVAVCWRRADAPPHSSLKRIGRAVESTPGALR